MSGRPVALSWSGGKDSALTAQALRADPTVDLRVLLTSVTLGYDRISIHGVRRALLEAQAERLGLPLIVIELEPNCTNEAYEAAFARGLTQLEREHPDVRTIAFGDLFLEDVRAYRERALTGTRFAPMFPLWGLDTRELAHRFIDDGFEARLVCVDTTQIDGGLGGRVFDRSLLDDLPPTADPCGEKGEFHTFVSAGPIFTAPISVAVGERVLRESRFVYQDLMSV